MKISIKNLESSTLELTVDGNVSSLAPGGSLDVDVSKSISVEPGRGAVGGALGTSSSYAGVDEGARRYGTGGFGSNK